MTVVNRFGVSTGLLSVRQRRAGTRGWSVLFALVAALVLAVPFSGFAATKCVGQGDWTVCVFSEDGLSFGTSYITETDRTYDPTTSARIVEITNNGISAIKLGMPPELTKYDLGKFYSGVSPEHESDDNLTEFEDENGVSTFSVEKDGTVHFSVTPKSNLQKGNCDESIIFTDEEGEEVIKLNASFTVKLKVTEPTATNPTHTYAGDEKSAGITANDTYYTITDGTGINANTYHAKVILKDKIYCVWEGKNNSDDLTIDWKIEKADPTNKVNWPSGLTAIYGQKLSDISSFLQNHVSPAGTFTWTNPVLDVGNVNESPKAHEVKFTPTGADASNYTDATKNVSVTVSAKSLTSVASVTLSPTSYTYIGSAITPMTVTVKVGTTTLVSGTDYTLVYSNNTNAGEATVTVTGTNNYAGTVTPKPTFTISPKALTNGMVSLSTNSFTFNDNPQKPTVTVTDGSNLTEDTHYTVTWPDDVTSEGIKTVQVKGKGNYDAAVTITKTYTIGKKSLNGATVVVSANSYIYNGQAKTPTVESVTLDATQVGSSAYDVSYNNNKDAGNGTAELIVTGKGNYEGSATGYFSIAKKDVTITGFNTNITKVYDGTPAVANYGTLSFEGVISGETQSVSSNTATYDNANAGVGKTISFANAFTMVAGQGTAAKPGNYNITNPQPTLTGTIEKATPTITTWPTASMVYGQTLADANLSGSVVTQVGGQPVDGTFAFTASTTKPTVAQSGTTYAMTFTPTNTNNFNSVTKSDVAITVNKAPSTNMTVAYAVSPYITILETDKVDEHEYDLSGITLSPTDHGTLSYALGTITNTSGVLASNPALSGTKLKYKGNGKTTGFATQIINITSANYTDFPVTITFSATPRTVVTITAQNVATYVYDGQPKTGVNGTPTGTTLSGSYADAFEYVYTGTSSPTTAPINVGTYKVKVRVPETNNNFAGTTADYQFTITPRPITLVADNISVSKGGNLPTLTYTVTNLPAGKTKADAISVEPTLACPTFNKNTVGEYPITITGGTATSNYNITGSTDGKVTVGATITFNPSSGTVTPASAATTSAGLVSVPLPTPTRTGYTFDGWYTASTGGTQVTASTVFTADATIYARWSIVVYTVIFDAAGGTGVSPAYGKTGAGWKLSSLPTNAKRNGYTFVDWYTAETGGTRVTTNTAFSQDATIYAHWTPVRYEIAYNLNSGKVATSNPGSYTIETADIKLNNPTRVAYTFAGWTGSNGSTKQTDVTIYQGSTGDKSYTANWTLVNYTITYNANGGTVSVATGKTGEGGKLTSLPTPTGKTGYTFEGWYTAETGGSQVTTSYVFGQDATVYARWSPTRYTITYNLNSGTVTPANPESYTIETASFTLTNPTRLSYTFDGWTGANGTAKQTAVTVATGSTGAKSFTANWTQNNYTITFNANGGSVSPATGKTGAGGKLTSLPTPTRTNYAFDGWYTSETGGAKVTTAYVFGEEGTVYARWTPIYTISFDANGGTVYTSYASTGAGGTLSSLPTPSRSGYTFDGWYTEKTGGAKVTTSTVFNDDDDVYAHWAVRTDVASQDREIPVGLAIEESSVAPVKASSGGVTVGPNPVKAGGEVSIYWSGTKSVTGSLSVFSATGDQVDQVYVGGTKKIGTWKVGDLADGTYLIKGVLAGKDGGRVKVSVLVAVVR